MGFYGGFFWGLAWAGGRGLVRIGGRGLGGFAGMVSAGRCACLLCFLRDGLGVIDESWHDGRESEMI